MLARILTVNTGSSSVRLGIFDVSSTGVSVVEERNLPINDLEPEAQLAEFLARSAGLPIDAVAHRVVHGAELKNSAKLTADVLKIIEQAAELAPLHNPRALRWIHAATAVYSGNITQCAVFDTALFATLPKVAASYAIPTELQVKYRIRRYGFHGIAHQAMLEEALKLLGAKQSSRIITLQLGSGCSITAFHDGVPIDTSMGFTPLEGLVMATRSGDVDPGVIFHLLERSPLSAKEIDHVFNKSSGLSALSGGISDMKELLQLDSPEAKFAVEVFCYRIRKYLGAYAAILGGLDAVVFGGGIGLHSAQIRAECLQDMGFLGIKLDQTKNRAAVGKEAFISDDAAAVSLLVLPVSEGALMAREVASLL